MDVLAFGAHPDDVELSCSGTILQLITSGKKVGIIDLTQGELGTRGTAKLRLQEAAVAAKRLGVTVRENLGFADGFFQNDKKHQLDIVKVIRKYRPEIVLANAIEDRHPDHGRAAALVEEACFLSGLKKIKTKLNGKDQQAWRPEKVFHYIQDRYIKPDFVVDISKFFEKKMQAIQAYKSQFFDPKSKEPETYISSVTFLEFIKARSMEMGHSIGVKYGEGFTCKAAIGVISLEKLL